MCLINSGCKCLHSRIHDGIQKHEGEIQGGHSQSLKKLKADDHILEHPMLLRQDYDVVHVVPTEEANHSECKVEFIIPYRYKSLLISSSESQTQYDSTILLKPTAGTLVMTDNVVTDCSKEEVSHIADIDDTEEMTVCYTNCTPSYVDSEEETSLNPNDTFTVPERATQENIDFKELSRDAKAFVSDDDGTSRNEAAYGILSSDRRNFNYSDYSFKAKIVGNSQLTDAYYESDRPHKPQDDLLKLPYSSNNNNPVKEPATS